MRMNRSGDDLGWNNRVRLLGGADRDIVRAILVVEELVGQNELVVVPIAIESSNRVGVVGPAFIPWDMPLDRPCLAAVKGLVESKQVVVPLGADEPLGGAYQVHRVGGIDPDIGLGVILDQHGGCGRIAGVATRLGGIGTEVLASVCSTIAGRFAAITIVRPITHRIWHLWSVATGLLCGRIHVGHAFGCVTVGVLCVALGSLGNVARAGA